MLKYFCILLLSINISFSSETVKLIDFLISGHASLEILEKFGVSGADAKSVESYLQSSFASLSSKKSVSKSEIMKILNNLPTTGNESAIKTELQSLLSKGEGELSKEDVVKAINHIIYLANRHGKSLIVTCSECVNDSLAKNGFKFTVENLKNSSSQKILETIIPNNPKDLYQYIASKMQRFALGDYSKISPKIIAPEEEKSFALFLGLIENGQPEIKNLTQAIKKISTTNGITNLIDPSKPNKFWKLAIADLSTEEVELWTKTLEQVAITSEKEKLTPEEAFYKILLERSQGNESLIKKYKSIKIKRCFFK